MIETFVRYVSAYTQRNVVMIELSATSIGIAIAGSVPKTNSRMISAPAAPSRASVSTLGPPASPCDSRIAACPVRCVVTPGGAACSSAARTALIGGIDVKVAFPGG